MTRAGVATRAHELVRRGQRQGRSPRGDCSMELHCTNLAAAAAAAAAAASPSVARVAARAW